MLSAVLQQDGSNPGGSMTETPFDRFPRPACADLLGWTLLAHDAAAGTAKCGFEGRETFLNPAGFIQGGMLAAMLDDTMGPAVFVATGGRLYTVTIDMHVVYLAPATPGRFIGDGRVVQLGKTIGFVEADLRDAGGVLVARGASSVRLVPSERLAA
jgi:uncharacterized protein (TIGR00369 family)